MVGNCELRKELMSKIKNLVKGSSEIKMIDEFNMNVLPTMYIKGEYKKQDPNGTAQAETWDKQVRKFKSPTFSPRFRLTGYGSSKATDPPFCYALFEVSGV